MSQQTTPSLSQAGVSGTPASGQRTFVIRHFLVRNGLWLGLVVLVAALSIASSSFRSVVNLQNVLGQNAVIGVVACGMLVIIIAGGFDMSVGASGGMVMVTTAWLSGHAPLVLAIAVGLLMGLVVGVINGAIVVRLNVNSFISTLAVSSVVSGVTLVATDAAPTQGNLDALTTFAFSRLLGIPSLFVVFLVFAGVTHLILTRTKAGHWIYSSGANGHASYLSGVPVGLVKIGAFTFGGLAVGVGSMLLLSQSAVGQPSAGSAWPLNAIATCVIAGASLSGGVGRVSNLIAAVLILGVVSNGLNQLGVSTYWQPAVSGVVILIAVVIDQVSRRAPRGA